MTFNNQRVLCEFSATEAIGQIVIWILLSIVTFGLAAFVAPYYLISSVLNSSYLLDQNGHKISKLIVKIKFSEVVGHAVIWILLTIVTLGLALFIYYTSVVKRVLNGVELEKLS